MFQAKWLNPKARSSYGFVAATEDVKEMEEMLAVLYEEGFTGDVYICHFYSLVQCALIS